MKMVVTASRLTVEICILRCLPKKTRVNHQCCSEQQVLSQWYSVCSVPYVANKVQSRFLVKQEVCFYLCCTEQLLETETQQHGAEYFGWWAQKANSGRVSLQMHEKKNMAGVNLHVNRNDSLLGMCITRRAAFCSWKISMHEPLREWLHAQSCGLEQQQQKPQLFFGHKRRCSRF